jgi:hypothetical protein
MFRFRFRRFRGVAAVTVSSVNRVQHLGDFFKKKLLVTLSLAMFVWMRLTYEFKDTFPEILSDLELKVEL